MGPQAPAFPRLSDICLRQNCKGIVVVWTGGRPPFSLSLYEASSSVDPAETIGPEYDTRYIWDTNLPPGTAVFITITDSAGGSQQSRFFRIKDSAHASCLSGSGAPSPNPTSSLPPVTTNITSLIPPSPPSSATSSSGTSIFNGAPSFPTPAIVAIVVVVFLTIITGFLLWRCKLKLNFTTNVSQVSSRETGNITSGSGGQGGGAQGENSQGGTGGSGGAISLRL